MNPETFHFDPLMIGGAVLLLLGWLAIPLAVRGIGFLVGLMGGILCVDFVHINFPAQEVPGWAYPVAAILLGVVGSFAARKLFHIIIFSGGVLAALGLKIQLDQSFNLSQQLSASFLGSFALTPWFTMAFGMIGGSLLSLLKRYLIIVLTALGGAVVIARSTGMEEKIFALTLFGMAFQTFCCTLKPKFLNRWVK